MDFFLLRLFWITVLCPVDYYVSSQDCAGKEPVIDPPSLVVRYGEPATANCSAQSKALIIGWEATVGADTENDIQQLVWSVPIVTEWALGRGVTCFSTSEENGQCKTDLPITIYKIPENVILSLLDHTGPLLEGQQYWLECVVESVAPAKNLTVIWFRGDTELKRSGFPQFFIVGDLSKDVTVATHLSLTASREDHEASYHCAAKLDLNTAEFIPETRSSIQLEVYYKPRVLKTSGNVTIDAGNKLGLMCVADANPRPSYQWRHKGVVLPNKDKNTLLIDSATADNAGVYECVISNTQGQASAVMSIEVKGSQVGLIIGIVVAVLILVVAAVGVLVWWRRQNQIQNLSRRELKYPPDPPPPSREHLMTSFSLN